jgi:hypothetical protein
MLDLASSLATGTVDTTEDRPFVITQGGIVMRPIRSKSRQRALQVALAVSWASSVPLAGCLNSPMRPDIAESAGKAALHAEHEINQKKIDAAMASVPHEESQAAGGLVLAGGAVEPEKDAIEQVAATEETASKPAWWQFWKSKPKSDDAQAAHEADESDSKTADSKSAVTASAKADLKKNSQAKTKAESEHTKPGVAKLPGNRSGTDPEKDALSPESWFGKNFPVAPVSSSHAKPEFDDIFKTESASQANPAQQPAATTAAKPADGASSRPFPSVGAQNPFAADTHRDGTLSANQSPTATTGTSPAAAPASPAATGANSMEAVVERHQRLRVKALLSDAHTNVIRGEFHAAYRAALLAEQVADENHLTFTGNEENPKELARQIAAKIWRISNPAEQAHAAAAQTLKPADGSANVPQTGTAVANKGASDAGAKSLSSQSFATWTPIPTDSKPAMSVASATPDEGQLPEIRPSKTSREPWNDANPAWQKSAPTPALAEKAATVSAAPQALPETPSPALSLEAAHPAQVPSAAEGGVKFAIAQTVSSDETTSTATPQIAPAHDEESPFPPAFTRPGTIETLGSAASEENRPKLMVPPARPIAQAAPREVPSNWDQLSAEADASAVKSENRPAASSLRQRFAWGLLGLLATGVCTAIGVQVAGIDLSLRRRGGSTPPPEEPQEQHSLKIKRVA